MIELRSDANTTRIIDTPIGHWLGALIGLILIIFLVAGVIRDFPEGPVGQTFVFGTLFCMTAGFIYLARAPFRETLVDRNLRTVSTSSIGLLSRRFVRFSFDDVEGGAVLDSKEVNGKFVFAVQLLLKNGKPIYLTSFDDMAEAEARETVDRINDLIGVTLSDGEYRPRLLDLE